MQNRKKTILWIVVILFVVFLLVGVINPVVLRAYKVVDKTIVNDIRIVQISDLHSQIYKNNQQQLITKIKDAKPDIIVLTGDIVDDKEPMTGAKLLFDGISNLAPIYYVSGNHEYWATNTDEILQMVKSYGIVILDEKTLALNLNNQKIVISGINDPEVAHYTERPYDISFLAELNDNDFNLLLAHRPERINEYTQYPVDLVLSGHAHGGQFAIPFILNGFIAPNQGFFPKYAGGKYEIEKTTMIVSRGLSYNKLIPRFYNKTEIVIIDIVGD